MARHQPLAAKLSVEQNRRQHRHTYRHGNGYQQTRFDNEGFFVIEHGKSMHFRGLGSAG
ncbi:hypothetical protein MPL3365_210084 [Mesorhizobium plurifarium]|uniref:Uncharacterized protein n=1 Tax=Mesorhizobium plurifarium TaxID=69974 RepID=A0A090GAD7_MESPL|nr:hypothetical protein MPL3365_210084 [Mesorhizobium plurifarium]